MDPKSTFENLSLEDRRDRLVKLLRTLVAEQGYTQRSLAVAIGISKSQVGHVLTRQRNLEHVELVDWLKALEVNITDFSKLLDDPVTD